MDVAELKRAFCFGHSLDVIAQATGLSRGTLSAYSARHNWTRDRVAGTEMLRKENGKMNDEPQRKPLGPPFSRGDSRNNRHGRPRHFDAFRELARKRRGRESNPRIAVLQTATLPLGYPAIFHSETVVSPLKNAVFEHLSL